MDFQVHAIYKMGLTYVKPTVKKFALTLSWTDEAFFLLKQREHCETWKPSGSSACPSPHYDSCG